MPCQMSSKELYTISHLNVKLLNIKKAIDREQHKFYANAEILIVGRMIIIFFCKKKDKMLYIVKERTKS